MPKGVYVKTKEHRKKLSEAHKRIGAPWLIGKKRPPFSKEWREKISKARWRGGKYKLRNRWLIFKPDHPFTPSNKYILNSRLVAEKCLGRYLEREETVHHINGKVDDDRPKNLYLFYSPSEHSRYEGFKEKSKLLSNLVIPS